MEKIDFMYDIMYVYDDKYEFKRNSKKPLLKLLSDTFIVKESLAIITIPVFALMLFVGNVHVVTGSLIGIMIGMIVFLSLRYYSQYKDVVIQKTQIQNVIIKKHKLIVCFHDNKAKRIITKIVTLPDNTKSIIDKLDKLDVINYKK